MSDGIIKYLYPPRQSGSRANDGTIRGAGQIQEIINGIPQGKKYTFVTPTDVDQSTTPIKVGEPATFDLDSHGQIIPGSVAAPTGIVCSLWVEPEEVAVGGAFELKWTSKNATSADIDQGIGNVTPVSAGSLSFIAGVDSVTYLLTVTDDNLNSDQDDATITVI